MSELDPDLDAELAALAAVDRVARAAALWLREETMAGRASDVGSPARQELTAGLVWGLCQWLDMDRPAPMLAAYACALLEHEPDAAFAIARSAAGNGMRGGAFARGVRAAQRLVAVVAIPATDRAAARRA